MIRCVLFALQNINLVMIIPVGRVDRICYRMGIEKDVALCVFKGGRSMDYVIVSLYSENFQHRGVCINVTVIFMD